MDLVKKYKDKTSEDSEQVLTEAETRFCELYVLGGSEFAGKNCRCYREVFGDTCNNVYLKSRKLIAQPHVLNKIKELLDISHHSETEVIAIKMQVTETLRAIMEETSTAQFSDRWGITISPAPMRAVAVNAAKALMELYPIKAAQETRLKIEGGEGGIVFNVIVPEPVKPKNED